MGGSPGAKKESNAERNARILSGKRAGTDATALNMNAAMLRRSRRRSSLFGGAEAGRSLGGAATQLGAMS